MQTQDKQHFLSLGKEGNCLKQFNKNLVDKFIGVIGPAHKGKTTVIKNLVDNILTFNINSQFEIIIVSRKKKDTDYNYLVGKIYNTSQIDDVCSYALNEQFRENKKIIIFEDYMTTDKINDLLIFNGRYHNLTIILSSQVITSIKPYIKDNLDYVFFTVTPLKSSIKSIFDRFYLCALEYKYFEQMFIDYTKNYNLFVVNNNISLNCDLDNLYDKISVYESKFEVSTSKNYILPDIYQLMPELVNSGDIKIAKKKLIAQINEIKKNILEQSDKLDKICIELDNLLGD
ncbi:hypothetical protein ma689 [Moumouvirus australiensis]|uniref:Uncharacterized protein n=1 Tax=Moumouvirus australiensis TaxID=2109587 RepID=A0A2P1EMF0_9VIRU|nr:hypothetical protein QKC55_gp215 [Moumouvirus australiensis]AVL95076.1 hypothetical protein ma689 [Moumouvirus australiensis]